MSEIKDQIDWKVIDQLHAATIEFSRNCSNIKKICVTLLIATCTLLAKFNDNSLDLSFFVAGFFIPLFFWGLDASSYFYQERLRGIINGKLNEIRNRNLNDTIITPIGYVLEIERNNDKRIYRSIFNYSMLLYYILLLGDLTLFIVYKMEWI
ncbi:hypothetical protein [Winogradskyella sp. 3972H.M.0a.05]|uniref:hypothetical protein n=1 Tax=Winogradskyella sp. 3972H.M.0a.05 TaxID=2950277 RepID=UPI003393FFF2